MIKKSLLGKLSLMLAVITLMSCDKDFNTIGSDIVGEDHFDLSKQSFEVKAKDFETGAVQSNNLKLNSLGVYSNGPFGTTTSHFVTQVSLPTTQMDFGINHVVDSVWVYVPYFNTQTGTNSNGIRTYALDSVYGGENKFDLKVYENGYYLADYNPDNANGIQRHYSDELSKVENFRRGHDGSGNSVLGGAPLNDSSNPNENNMFWFNPEEKIIYKTEGTGQYVDASGDILDDQDDLSQRVIQERFLPGMWVNLNKEFVKKRILQASSSNIFNNNNFREYFRGLYFKSEKITGMDGALASLDFSKGYIRVEYKADFDLDNNPTTPRVTLSKSLRLGLSGNTVNFFETTYSKPTDPEHLYLKGGQGSVAYINVFNTLTDNIDEFDDVDNNEIPDLIDNIKANGWMINEANLTFYVDQNELGSSVAVEPDRIYLYDVKNKKPIIDYLADGSINGSKPKYNKRGFGGIIEKEPAPSGKGIKYKIRITEYLKSCIKNDSTNFVLGLSVTEDIAQSANAYRKINVSDPSEIIPVASVMSPLGTVLHSPNSANAEKRLKLEIYYTKPD